jgi:hypothetical protein
MSDERVMFPTIKYTAFKMVNTICNKRNTAHNIRRVCRGYIYLLVKLPSST